jgi:hypothetical protein
MTLEEIFNFYSTVFLPNYSRVTAETLEKPVQVAVEIENAFSHIAVYYEFAKQGNQEKQSEHISKAKGHLERATLDCLKLTLIEVARQARIFEKPGVLEHATTGKLQETRALLENFKISWKETRRKEVCGLEEDPETRIQYYTETIKIADDLMFLLDYERLAKLKSFWFMYYAKSLILSFALGAMSGVLGNYIFEFLKQPK